MLRRMKVDFRKKSKIKVAEEVIPSENTKRNIPISDVNIKHFKVNDRVFVKQIYKRQMARSIAHHWSLAGFYLTIKNWAKPHFGPGSARRIWLVVFGAVPPAEATRTPKKQVFHKFGVRVSIWKGPWPYIVRVDLGRRPGQFQNQSGAAMAENTYIRGDKGRNQDSKKIPGMVWESLSRLCPLLY